MVCKVEGEPENRVSHIEYATRLLDAVWQAVKQEKETETKGAQLHAIRDVIKELKTPFLHPDIINKI